MAKRSFIALLLSFALCFVLATLAVAQEKKKAAAKEDRISGRVHMINKDTSVITVRVGNVQRQVVYNSSTKFTFRNQAGSLDDVKDGRRVICLGKFDDKARLVATRVDIREK